MAAPVTTTVWYKFLSARDFSEIRFPGLYVGLEDLKWGIRQAHFKARFADSNSGRYKSIQKGCCLGTDHDLSIIDPLTKTPYSDYDKPIVDGSSVLVRRVPGDRRGRLYTNPIDLRPEVAKVKAAKQETKSYSASDSVITTKSGIDDFDYEDFGGDVYAVATKPAPEEEINPAPAAVDSDEESRKIMALVNTPALRAWSAADSTLTNTRKRRMPFSTQPPSNGYVCHRCGVEGHFIQDCPTNGDPNYDRRKRMRPTAVEPSAAAESEFDKQMEGISSLSRATTSTTTTTSSSSSSGGSSRRSNGTTVGVPADLNCPLCRGVMKEAVIVKSCCFRSYCKSCITDYVKRFKTCACGRGARNVDACGGDFVPNLTVRSMIDAILQRRSCSSSGSSAGSNSCCSTVIST